MKRSLPSIAAGLVLIVFLGLYMITYVVQENQVAVVRTFGKITQPDATGASPDIKTAPGLYWKWPWPVQQVVTYDNRLQITETKGEETPTADAKNVIVTTVIGWRIADPYEFSIVNSDMAEAEQNLTNRVRNDQKTVIGRYEFGSFVSTDPEKLQYDQIEQEIFNEVVQGARELYGIEVVYVGIERLALPTDITKDVFTAMREERNSQAARYESMGESEAERIKAEAENIAGTIESFAKNKAEKIIAQGKAQAAEQNEVFARDEGLAVFLLEIDYLKEILKERATLILDQQPPFHLLSETFTGAPASPPSGPVAEPKASGDDLPVPSMIEPN